MSPLPPLPIEDPQRAPRLQGRSLAIAASAGSGKTFALVVLMLGFLGREGNRAFEAVATTFGRESASDLKSRILLPLDELARWREQEWEEALAALASGWEAWDRLIADRKAPEEIAFAARQWTDAGARPAWMGSAKEARDHWIRARREAEGLRVGTVHSEALEVLRRSGHAGASLMDATDPRLVSLLRQAGRECLDLAAEHPDHLVARELLAWAEGWEAQVPRWERLCEAFDGHMDALGSWREDTGSEETTQAFWEAAEGWLAAYRPFGEAPETAGALTKEQKLHKTFSQHGILKLVPAPGDGAPRAELLRFAESLAASVPTGEGDFQRYFHESFREAMAPLQEELPDLLEHWLSLLLERVFRCFEALKDLRGWLCYGDLARRALDQLRARPPKPAPKLLLVDEYQDISPVQDAFLAALGADATVVVGDRKQAIYGFRGGQAALLEARIAAASAQGLAFCLPRNHRSTAPVVEVANAYVREVMPRMDPGAADPEGAQEDGGKGRGEPLVALGRVDSPKRRGADLPAAGSWIAALGRNPGWEALGMASLLCRGERRRALLLPQRTGLPALRRQLQQRGIEPLVASQSGFWESPGVRLMMALLETVAFPARRLPFFAVMRSAWVGAVDPALRDLAASWKTRWTDLDTDGFPAPIQEGLRWLRAQRGASTQRILAGGWAQPGLLEALAATEVHGRLEPERARRNLEEFLGWIPSLPADPVAAFADLDRKRALRKGDAPADASSADLLIQTVHASKGLEYEDVILPMLNYPVKGIRKGEVGRRGDSRHLLLGWKLGRFPASGLRDLRREEKQRVLREGLNLLYVALTRARHRLVLLHQWEPEDASTFRRPSTATGQIEQGRSVAWPHVASELAARLPQLPEFDEPPSSAPETRTAPAAFREAPRGEPLAPAPPEPAEGSEERAARQRHGTALHGLLREALVRHAVDPRAVENHLRDHPVVRRWPGSAESVRRLLAVLEEKGWDRLPRRTEFPLPGAGSGGGMGYADLVLWEPDRARPQRIHVVDFKLSLDPEAPEMEAYRAQLEGYRRALRMLHPSAEADVWLYALDRGLLLEG